MFTLDVPSVSVYRSPVCLSLVRQACWNKTRIYLVLAEPRVLLFKLSNKLTGVTWPTHLPQALELTGYWGVSVRESALLLDGCTGGPDEGWTVHANKTAVVSKYV